MPKNFSNLPAISSPELAPRVSLLRERYPHLDEVESFVKCVAKLEPLGVILFGSLVSGEFTQHSDADVAVIFPKPVDWLTVYRCSSGWVQPLVYSAEQFLQMIDDANGMALEICHDGWVLSDDGDYLARVREAFEQARRKYALEKTATGWQLHSG